VGAAGAFAWATAQSFAGIALAAGRIASGAGGLDGASRSLSTLAPRSSLAGCRSSKLAIQRPSAVDSSSRASPVDADRANANANVARAATNRFTGEHDAEEARMGVQSALVASYPLSVGASATIRKERAMRTILAACLALVAAIAAGGARAEISGAARAVDGETLEVGGKWVVFWVVQPPPAGQSCREWAPQGQREYPCGALARAFMQSLVAGREVFCVEEAGGNAATCFADGRDLALSLVQAGWGLAAQKASSRYVNQEQTARQTRNGLWAGSSANPDEWGGGGAAPRR
jgi:endonuclease YncB( thermonuclease family)